MFAVSPEDPEVVAGNAAITVFDPADPTKAPITLVDSTESPLPNPVVVTAQGFGPAFQHPTLDRVGWFGAGLTGYFTSYEGMKNEAKAAKEAAQASSTSAAVAQSNAATAQAAAEAAAADAAEAALAATGGGVAEDPLDADVLLFTTKTDGSVIIDPSDADALQITT
jgi:hypothetical protein